MSIFQPREWVEIVGYAVDDPPIFRHRSVAQIAEVVEHNGAAQYYVRLDATHHPLPPRFGPFPETRFRRCPQ